MHIRPNCHTKFIKKVDEPIYRVILIMGPSLGQMQSFNPRPSLSPHCFHLFKNLKVVCLNFWQQNLQFFHLPDWVDGQI